MGHADDGGLGDVGVLVERGLDLGRVDVLAAADDHVLEAVDDVEVAVVVEPADVAGVEPAVGEGVGGRLGRGRSSRATTVGPFSQISPTSPVGNGVAVGVGDADLDHRRDRLADALGLGDVGRAEVGDGRAGGLGQPVAVARRGPRRELLVDAADELGRHERGARGDAGERRRARCPCLRRHLEQLEHRGRHAGDGGDAARAR